MLNPLMEPLPIGRLQDWRIAHIGNSIQYYNDCPRLLQRFFEEATDKTVTQDSCFRGGASLVSLWDDGNDINIFTAATNQGETVDIGSATVQTMLSQSNDWDVIIINDHTQSPADPASRARTLALLQQEYQPLFKTATPIILQTPAYRQDTNGSERFGTFDEFTAQTLAGCQEYADAIGGVVAPIGNAFQYIRRHADPKVFDSLYARDNFHPSPHGTLLQAMVLYATISGMPPPPYDERWWETSRVRIKLPLPTKEEAKYLQSVACRVCRVLGNEDQL